MLLALLLFAALEGRILHPADADDVRALALITPSIVLERTGSPAAIPLELLAAYRAQNVDEAYRLSTRYVFKVLGETWHDDLEVLTSYRLKLDRRIVEPGDPLHVTLEPIFNLGRPPNGDYRATLTLKGTGKDAAIDVVSLNEFADVTRPVSTKGLKDGDYVVRYQLTSGGKMVVTADRLFTVRKGLRKRLAKLDGLPDPSVRYIVEAIQKALKGYYASARLRAHPMSGRIPQVQVVGQYVGEPFDLDRDLPLAEALRKRPPAAIRGDLHLAYRSSIDNTLQPFRLFLPPKTVGPLPLIVVLHGAGGDESTYFGPFARLQLAAAARGYAVVSPSGRGPFGGYSGNSEKDVLDVIDVVAKMAPVDPKRVYLTGHSMGAMGTWSIGFNYPQRFAALAPVAGAANVSAALLEKAPSMPVLLVQGGKDALAVPAAAQKAAELGKRTLKAFVYQEWPDADHFTIGAVSVPAILDFFDRAGGVRDIEVEIRPRGGSPSSPRTGC